MSTTTQNPVLHVTSAGEVHLRLAKCDRKLSDAESFALGYSFVQTRKYSVAARVFRTLAHHDPDSPEFRIMLARCQVGLKDYEGGNNTLQSLFGDVGRDVADGLQTAFVFEALGMWDDAIADLQKVAERHAEMPLLSLLLGDLYSRKRNPNQAVRCWKAATGIDGKGGCVTLVARRRLQRLTPKRRSVFTQKSAAASRAARD